MNSSLFRWFIFVGEKFMKNKKYLLWEKVIVFLVMGLVLIQGGFFEDSYLAIGGFIALLMTNDKQIVSGDKKLTFGLVIISAFCILYHLLLEKAALSGYILCFLVIYILAVQRNDLLKAGIFYGIIVMNIIGILAYCGIDIGTIIRNNRFMGTFQYANTTAIILVFTIIYLKECDDEIYCRWQLLNYVFLFFTCSIGGIVSYILAVFYCLLDNRNNVRLWLNEIITLLLSVLIAAMIYFVSFVLKISAINFLIFMIVVILSWNFDQMLNRFIERVKYVKVILTMASIICITIIAISIRFIAVNRAVKTFEERIWQMQDGLNILKNNMITGVGSYGWKENLLKWRNHDYEVNIIHNSYLHICVKYGIVMFIMLFLVTIYLIYCSREWDKNRQAVLYVGIMHAFFDIDFFFMGYCGCILFVITETVGRADKTKYELKNIILYRKIFMIIIGIILVVRWMFIVFGKIM